MFVTKFTKYIICFPINILIISSKRDGVLISERVAIGLGTKMKISVNSIKNPKNRRLLSRPSLWSGTKGCSTFIKK